jgi:hypothetical protein
MKRLISVLLIALIAAACGNNKKKDPDPKAGVEGVNGMWLSSACVPNDTEYRGPKYMIRYYELRGADVVTRSMLYKTDPQCGDNDAVIEVAMYSHYQFKDISNSTFAGLYTFDESVDTYTLTPMIPEEAGDLHDSKYCGKANWMAGTETSVTNCPFGKQKKFVPVNRYNILQVNLEAKPPALRFGVFSTPMNGNTPQARPPVNQLSPDWLVPVKLPY